MPLLFTALRRYDSLLSLVNDSGRQADRIYTYRSRDVDLQSPVSLDDTLAVVEYVRALPYVDGKSVVMFGCSGGGDLALEVPTRTKVCAVVAEEPASMVMAGMFNNRVPKKGERYTPEEQLLHDGEPERARKRTRRPNEAQ